MSSSSSPSGRLYVLALDPSTGTETSAVGAVLLGFDADRGPVTVERSAV